MSNKQNNETVSDAALLAMAGKGGSGQDKLAELLATKLQREMADEAAEKRRTDEYREALRSAITKTMKDKEAVQNSCPHMKPNFRPALGGQRDHSGNYHFICQYCQKEWHSNEGPLPYHLQIPAEMVGGPQ